MVLDTLQPFEQYFTITPRKDGSNKFIPPTDDHCFIETFHQNPHGDLRPTFYDPFETRQRRRTSRAQLKILEDAFIENQKPNGTIRRILAEKLGMTPRGVQIWFQNRRAKEKVFKKDKEEVPSTTIAVNQSSVLFSQFVSNHLPEKTNTLDSCDHDWMLFQQEHINHNIRTLATTAAAIAAAASLNESTMNSWTNIEFENEICSYNQINQSPISRQEKMINVINQSMPYFSPSWSPDVQANNMNIVNKPRPSFDAYGIYATPPLTASGSASTVAGSPISLDNLKSFDPIVLPANDHFYNSFIL